MKYIQKNIIIILIHYSHYPLPKLHLDTTPTEDDTQPQHRLQMQNEVEDVHPTSNKMNTVNKSEKFKTRKHHQYQTTTHRDIDEKRTNETGRIRSNNNKRKTKP